MTDEMMNLPRPDHIKMHQRSSVRRLERQRISPANGTPAIARYDAERAAKGEMLSIENVLEILSVPLLGVVPESEEVLRASNLGSPISLCNAESAAARAYYDAARRLRGESLPITLPSNRKRLLDKLFGRRAA